jgi:RNA polymerase sigma factor (sigma-70 family)
LTCEDKRELEALMLRLADGDRSAFDPLYDALWPLVRRLTERMLNRAPEGEDAAQEAMLKVFGRASAFEPGQSVQTWVLAITAYECLTQRKRARRRRETSVPDEVHQGARPSPEDDVIARDLEAAAREVLGTLRPADVDVLLAAASGTRPKLPATTFRKRLERALRRARTAWSSRHD